MTQITTDNKKDDVVKISSVSEYLEAIRQIQPVSKGESIFYRGESKDYGESAFLPGILRPENKNLLNKECDLYHNVFFHNPDYFKKDKTVFEKLVRMQHYNLPTRLLDITSNPLVALFFACNSNLDDEGIVYMVKKNNLDLEHYDKEEVQFISNRIFLSKYKCTPDDDFYEKWFVKKIFLFFIKYLPTILLDSELKSIDCVDKLLRDFYLTGLNKENIKERYYSIAEATKIEFNYNGLNYLEHFIKVYFNAEYKFPNLSMSTEIEKHSQSLDSEIKKDLTFGILNKGLSNDSIAEKLRFFISNTYIKAPQANKRLKSQSGAFIFYGNSTKKEDFQLLKIKSECKEEILKELERLNINKATIYPELENICEYYKEKYLETIRPKRIFKNDKLSIYVTHDNKIELNINFNKNIKEEDLETLFEIYKGITKDELAKAIKQDELEGNSKIEEDK